MPFSLHRRRRLAPGLYVDEGVGHTVRLVAVDQDQERVMDNTMTRSMFNAAKRFGLLDLLASVLENLPATAEQEHNEAPPLSSHHDAERAD